MPSNKYANFVFQGGGVRGIAYAGVLASKPDHVRINAVAGTSAGSIVAGLLAIGKSPVQIKAILENPQLRSLVADDQMQRTERIKKAWNDLKAVWFVDKKEKLKISYRGALKFAWSHRDVFSEIKSVWDNKGFHSSERLRKFLDEIFEGRTFENLAVEDLKIVAADVSRQEYEIYSRNKNLTTPIAQAVHASVSIPLFFEPFVVGPEHFVDGGLLSNFPSFLFAQGFYPTIGFRLVDVAPPKDINSTPSFLQAFADNDKCP